MKVLAVNHTAALGGAERALLALIERERRSTDTEFVLACPQGSLADAARQKDIRVITGPWFEQSLRTSLPQLPGSMAKLVACGTEVRTLADSITADVVYANSIRSGIYCGIAARRGGPPAVTHVHDCLPPSSATRVVRGLVLRSSTCIVANSAYTAESFSEGGRAAERTFVVYNAFDDALLDPDRAGAEQLRQFLDIGEEAPVVAIVAQITPWKGQEIAIRAFDGVRKSFPGAKLLIVGKAKFKGQETRFDNVAYEQSLHQLVIDRELQQAVLFTGEQHDVRPVMNLADVVLMPSWEEPFGRAAVEGMAAGKCVISTNVGGPPEFIVDRETGRLLDPTDVRAWSKAMIELLHDRDERWRIGGAARASVERTFFGSSTRTLITPVFEHALGLQSPMVVTA